METDENVEPAELEELDIEEFTRAHPADSGKPCARFYVIRIDRERKRVGEPELNGTQILALVDKAPDTHKLFQKFRGGQIEVIEPCEIVSPPPRPPNTPETLSRWGRARPRLHGWVGSGV